MNPVPAGDAFQINGVWHQDYLVDDGNGNQVVKRYYYDGTDWKSVESKRIDLAKKITDTPSGINLKKSVVNLDKTLVNLSKKANMDIASHVARVAVAVDFSYSMKTLYTRGDVQKSLNRLIPISLRFDDNGELEVWLFHDGFVRIGDMNLGNYENYVRDNIMQHKMGATNYAPVLKDIKSKYIIEDPDNIPTFVIFITDGDNYDKRETNEIIRDLSNYNIFVQFVGIGGGPFGYLEQLDDLSGRRCDNTGFISVDDFTMISDDVLYEKLLEQYIDWLKVLGLH